MAHKPGTHLTCWRQHLGQVSQGLPDLPSSGLANLASTSQAGPKTWASRLESLWIPYFWGLRTQQKNYCILPKAIVDNAIPSWNTCHQIWMWLLNASGIIGSDGRKIESRISGKSVRNCNSVDKQCANHRKDRFIISFFGTDLICSYE